MKIGPYSIFPELPSVLLRNLRDAHRIRTTGIPRVPGDTPVEIATAVLLHNAKEVLIAGQGHFVFMWPTDFGKSIRGALQILPESYLRNLIELMIVDAASHGFVRSCFSNTPKFHGFDMPYARADNLPWLLHSVYEHKKSSNDDSLLHTHKKSLQKLIDVWEDTHLENGLIKDTITGDWMDTVLRPSSTYNNLCTLHLIKTAALLGLTSKHTQEDIEKKILADRLRGDYFIDYKNTEQRSIDASVLALYLELFDTKLRTALAERLQQSDEVQPYPIRCATHTYPLNIVSPVVRFSPHYHDGIWLHLGMMYMNGLKKIGRDVTPQRTIIDALSLRYGNMIETLAPDGTLYTSLLHATEYGLTMTAGQYIELTS